MKSTAAKAPLFGKRLGALLADTTGRVTREIPVDLIDPDPGQPRKEFSDKTLLEIGASIKAEGQLQPVELIDKGDGRYLLVIGERRWRGAVRTGLPTLEAFVSPATMTPAQIRRRQLIENLQREAMSAADTARSIEQLVKEEGSAERAAAAIGLSEAQVSKYLALQHLPPMTAGLAETGMVRDVETLATVGAVERADPATAEALVEQATAQGGLSRSQARQAAQAVRAGRSASPAGRQVKRAASLSDAAAQEKPRRAPVGQAATAAVLSVGGARPVVPAAAEAPAPLLRGQALAVGVEAVPTHAEAMRFALAVSEHGSARLYMQGVAPDPASCWVQFGDSAVTRSGDKVPRLQKFPCAALTLVLVDKIEPDGA